MSGRCVTALVAAALLASPAAALGQTQAAHPPLLGEWVAAHECAPIVAMLHDAGLDEFILEQIWGNDLLPGATSDADIEDPDQPCDGTIARRHSHFFTDDGRFGSRDHAGRQVDDGTYVLDADDLVWINGVAFRYAIDGDRLTLDPELPDVSGCTTRECRFPAAWMLMVALPGSIWTRATAIVGTWQRTNSCRDLVTALEAAGLQDQIAEWVLHQPDVAVVPPDPCADVVDVPHSHFFHADGQFGSLSETGERVDFGGYEVSRPGVLAFPVHGTEFGTGPIEVEYGLDVDDRLVFEIVIPDACDASCRRGLGWAFSAFYPSDPWERR